METTQLQEMLSSREALCTDLFESLYTSVEERDEARAIAELIDQDYATLHEVIVDLNSEIEDLDGEIDLDDQIIFDLEVEVEELEEAVEVLTKTLDRHERTLDIKELLIASQNRLIAQLLETVNSYKALPQWSTAYPNCYPDWRGNVTYCGNKPLSIPFQSQHTECPPSYTTSCSHPGQSPLMFNGAAFTESGVPIVNSLNHPTS